MKNRQVITVIALVVIVLYLSFSFILMEANPLAWTRENRAILITLIFTFVPISLLVKKIIEIN